MMKKRMLLICVVLCTAALIMSVSGCASDVQDEAESTAKPTSLSLSPYWTEDTPDEVVMVECQFYGDTMYNKEYKEAWPEAVSERYGLSVIMQYPQREGYMETLEASAMAGDLTGLVEIFGGPYLLEWRDKGWIYPLDEFLKDNNVWNTVIPDFWKDACTFDGEVWAIPTGSDGSATWFARSMRGDWLDNLEMEKPYTINEFYEASYKFTYNDPDKNNRDDTAGFTSVGTWNIQDIFQAFDARLNHVADPVPAWNPNTNAWEDSLIKPEMAQCLTFLKKCYDEKVLDNDLFAGITGEQMRNNVSEGRFGGAFYWDSWVMSFESKVKRNSRDAYMVCVGALSGNIEKNLNHYNVGIGAPRVMMKTTKQPKETINWYVNTFFGDEWGFWTGRIGPVGETRGEVGSACTIEGNTVVRNTYVDSVGNVRFYPTPGYIGGLPSRALYTVYEIEFHIPGNQDYADMLKETLVANYNKRVGFIDEYIANEMAYILPENLKESTSPKYMEIVDELNDVALEAIRSSITGTVGITEALAKYKTEAKRLGVIEILDFENEKLGKKTTQTYN